MLRLDHLEEQLGDVAQATNVATLSAEAVAAYHRVQVAMWEDGTCDIDETSPCVFTCGIVSGSRLVPIPVRCDVPFHSPRQSRTSEPPPPGALLPSVPPG